MTDFEELLSKDPRQVTDEELKELVMEMREKYKEWADADLLARQTRRTKKVTEKKGKEHLDLSDLGL